MKLGQKKSLAARTLKIGKERIIFLQSRLEEIKEAITKQDIKDLVKEGAILIKEISGKRKSEKKKKTRGTGKIRKKVNVRKRTYVIMTRKLRRYVAEMKKQGKLTKEEATEIRKKIRNRQFKSKAHLKEQIEVMKK